MNITLSNATVGTGSELILMDINHTVTCDEKTKQALREHFCPTKPPCPCMSDNTYSAVCTKDDEPCNGDFKNCRIVAKGLQATVSQKAIESAVELAGMECAADV